MERIHRILCLGAACTGCINTSTQAVNFANSFASALPARGASQAAAGSDADAGLCLGAACTGCIPSIEVRLTDSELCLGAACTGCIPNHPKLDTLRWIFASALPARGASARARPPCAACRALPRRCLHGVHRQKPTNCGTPFCSIRRESVDSFSEINNTDSCADYFPALFCCQGDLHHHYRQPRTGNRPVLRCEQHRLFLFILSSHYRRLL